MHLVEELTTARQRQANTNHSTLQLLPGWSKGMHTAPQVPEHSSCPGVSMGRATWLPGTTLTAARLPVVSQGVFPSLPLLSRALFLRYVAPLGCSA